MIVAVKVACRGAAAARSRQPRSASRGVGEIERQLGDERARADGVQAELELGDDPEVAAAAAQSPEQLGMLVGADAQDLAGGGHERVRDDVVAGQSVLTGQPAHAAAERQAADAGVRDVAGGRRQPVGLRGAVQRAQRRAALHPRAARDRIDAHAVHRAQVDHQAVVGDRQADDVVAAAADPDLEIGVAGQADGGDDVGGARRTGRSCAGGGRPSRSRRCGPRRSRARRA